MSKILSDPIDWTRDERLAAVPTDVSMQENVDKRWNRINQIVFDGVPVEHEVKYVEEALALRQKLMNDDKLRAGFDWKYDFEAARSTHRFHLANLDYVKNKRVSYLAFWRDWVSESTNFYREAGLNGQKAIFLLRPVSQTTCSDRANGEACDCIQQRGDHRGCVGNDVWRSFRL